MARVFIDPHMFGEAWFGPILDELRECNSVVFVFGSSVQHIEEKERVIKALTFYKIAGSLKTSKQKSRRIDVSAVELDTHISYLNDQECFKNCSACDDPHIFALVYCKPTKYIFSQDARMARCRTTINKTVDSRYCTFIIVSSAPVYNSHKSHILS